MTYSLNELENSDLDEMTYYSIQVWVDKTKTGESLDTAYDDKVDAVFEMEKLIRSGKYEMVILRENEVWKRRNDKELSSSGVVCKWEIQEET